MVGAGIFKGIENTHRSRARLRSSSPIQHGREVRQPDRYLRKLACGATSQDDLFDCIAGYFLIRVETERNVGLVGGGNSFKGVLQRQVSTSSADRSEEAE